MAIEKRKICIFMQQNHHSTHWFQWTTIQDLIVKEHCFVFFVKQTALVSNTKTHIEFYVVLLSGNISQ